MDTNNMYCRPAYKCGVCGKEHSEISARAKCEIACLKKQEEEAKKAAEEKKNAEKEARKKEVDVAFTNLIKLYSAYIKDYGYYEFEIEDKYRGLRWPSKFWNYFM